MCMEDVRLGREKNGAMRNANHNAQNQILPTSRNRTMVIFAWQTEEAGTCLIWPHRATMTAAIQPAFQLSQYCPILKLTVEEIGNMIFDSWFSSDTGTGTLAVVDVGLEKQ